MVRDNSVTMRVLHRRESSAPLGSYFTPAFWKSEQAEVEHPTQVTDDHQSILAWLAWGREGRVVGWVGGWGGFKPPWALSCHLT